MVEFACRASPGHLRVIDEAAVVAQGPSVCLSWIRAASPDWWTLPSALFLSTVSVSLSPPTATGLYVGTLRYTATWTQQEKGISDFSNRIYIQEILHKNVVCQAFVKKDRKTTIFVAFYPQPTIKAQKRPFLMLTVNLVLAYFMTTSILHGRSGETLH